MMVRLVAITMVVLSAASAWAGQRYYVTGTGAGAQNGSSWANAFDHPDALGIMVAGDTAIFGTGTWYDVRIDPPGGGSASAWTVYACSSYIFGNTPAEKLAGKYGPKLYGGDLISGGWSGPTSGYWSQSHTPTSSKCEPYESAANAIYTFIQSHGTFGGDSLLVPHNSLGDVTSNGDAYYNHNTGTIYVRPYNGQNPNTLDIIASCHPVFAFNRVNNVDHIRVWGLDLRGGKSGTVYFNDNVANTPTDTTSFEHCHIAFSGIYDGNNPGAWFHDHIDAGNSFGNRLVACSLGWAASSPLGSAPANNAPWAGLNNHGGVIGAYAVEQMVVESCYVYGYARSGISFKCDQMNSDAPYEGNTVKFSEIWNIGRPGAGIEFRVRQINDSAYGNVIHDVMWGILFDGDATNVNPTWQESCVVLNNTIYDFLEAGITHVGLDQARGGHEIRYNIFEKFAGQALSDVPRMIALFAYEGNNSAWNNYWAVDSNAYYDAEGDYMWSHTGTSILDFPAWQATANGLDVRGTILNNSALTGPENGDFSPTGSVPTMNRNYGGRTWTRWGAIQDNTPIPPVANFRADPAVATVGTPIFFTDLSTGTISSWLWDFGDGATSTQRSPSHTYATVGSFTVSLAVSGPAGSANDTKPDYVQTQPPGADVDPPAASFITIVQPNSNIALGGTVTVCGSYAGYSPAVLNDGVIDPNGLTSTTWSSDESGAENHWITVDFPTSVDVDEVRLFWAWNSARSAWMTSSQITIQQWTGTQWADVTTINGPAAGEFTIQPIPAVNTSRLRFFQPAGQGPSAYPNVMWLTELEIMTP